jgi:hypothetical protein
LAEVRLWAWEAHQEAAFLSEAHQEAILQVVHNKHPLFRN